MITSTVLWRNSLLLSFTYCCYYFSFCFDTTNIYSHAWILSLTKWNHNNNIPFTEQQRCIVNNFGSSNQCIVSSNTFNICYHVQSPASVLIHRTSAIWMSPSNNNNPIQNDDPTTLSEEQYEINSRIYTVAKTVCNLSSNQINIEWKPNRIIITVNVENAYIDATEPSDDDDDDIVLDALNDDEFDDIFDLDPIGDLIDDPISLDEGERANHNKGNHNDVDEVSEMDDDNTNHSIDLTLLARAINVALDDNNNNNNGALCMEQYEIEVTTPGSSNELTTPIMFTAYRGFDVIVTHQDPKTKKMKCIEGRLVERNIEYTIVNIKGRIKHLKNMDVQSVKLPKAKKEKGIR